jgi:hypothetical protein
MQGRSFQSDDLPLLSKLDKIVLDGWEPVVPVQFCGNDALLVGSRSKLDARS